MLLKPLKYQKGLKVSEMDLRRAHQPPRRARLNKNKDLFAREGGVLEIFLEVASLHQEQSPPGEGGLGAGVGSSRGTSLIRSRVSLGPYIRTMPRALWWSLEGGLFLMSEVPL